MNAAAVAAPSLPSYGDALAWLYARRRDGAPRDPDRMRAVMSALGLSAPGHVVHVVGTNGKGTVASMVDAGLRAAGSLSGRFTSPHVEDFRERVAVGGRPLAREAVRRFVALAATPGALPDAAFFELALALALWTFERRGVAWGVFEAGVGGARDATRALDGVALVVLTNVALDHLRTLGADLASIARAKAGALRPGVPVVTGAEGTALAVVRAEAARLGCPLHVDDGSDPLFDVPAAGDGSACCRTALDRPGGARWRNARLAAAALRLLGVPEPEVAAGLATPPLPARGERFLVAGREVILDGAHDPAAAALLAASLAASGTAGYTLLFGALARKQGPGTLAALDAGARRVVLTQAAPVDSWLPRNDPRLVADPGAALAQALHETPPGGLLVVAGSLYLAGRLRPTLRRLHHGSPRSSAAGRGRRP